MKILTREEFYKQLEKILSTSVSSRENNFIQVGAKTSLFENQNQTNEAFSEKWEKY